MLSSAGFKASAPVPIVPMRIQSVKGRPVAAMLADTLRSDGDGSPNGWSFRHEYRSTYRDTLVSSERIVAGKWWTGRAPGEISVEDGVARELGVGVDDSIVWDVQGVLIPTRITSLRDVEWARFEPNFFVVFAPGVAREAPQITRDPHADRDARRMRGAFQRRLAERFPNVTTLDLSLAAGQTLERG